MVVARRQRTVVSLGLTLLVLSIASSFFSASVEGGSKAGGADDLWGHLSPAAFRQRSLIGIARSIADEHPDVVWPAVEKFMEAVGMEIVDGVITILNQTIDIGNATIDFPPVTSECPLCMIFATLIKVFEDEYETLETAVIDLCFTILKPFGVRVDPLCNGTIKLQGPHIKTVLVNDRGKPRVTPGEFCEYINACLAPPAKSNGAGTSTEIDGGQTTRQRLSRRRSRQTEREEERTKRSRPTEDETGQKQATIKVVQLTDIHIERNYAVGSSTDCGLPVCCLSKWGPGNAWHLGDYHCNIPRLTIEFFLERVKTFNPDIILFSGDVPPHTVWEETIDSQMECSEVLVDTLARNLSGYKVYPILGNHEMYPTNLFSLNRLSFTKGFVFNWKTLWAPMANISINDFEASGSYSVLLRPGLRLVTFNSNYFYTFNWYNVLNDMVDDDGRHETEDMRTFLQTSLEDAKTNGEKVILVGHHPPGGADYIVKASRWFVQLVLNYSDVIVLMPTGHTHIDEFRLIFDDADQPQGVVYVAPSISAGGQKNPSMRVYHLDATTYEVLDYDHYFLDLRPTLEYYTSGKSIDSIDWKMMITLLYSAKMEYNLPDLSPKSWHDLLKRFDTNSDLLAKHRQHSSADSGSNSGRCSEYCKGSHICRMSNANYDEYLDCVPERTPPQGPGSGGGGEVESGGSGLPQVVASTYLCSIIALLVPQLLMLVQSKTDF